MASIGVERRYLGRNAAGLVRTDRHGENYDVAFVTLHVLNVFDEDRLSCLIAVEMRIEGRITAPGLVQHVLDQSLLVAVKRHYSYRLGRSLHASDDLGNDGFGFFAVHLGATAFVDAAFDMNVSDCGVTADRGGKSHQLTAIVFRVRERDQTLMAAPVVPGQAH